LVAESRETKVARKGLTLAAPTLLTIMVSHAKRELLNLFYN
jgi:hypothetical protein